MQYLISFNDKSEFDNATKAIEQERQKIAQILPDISNGKDPLFQLKYDITKVVCVALSAIEGQDTQWECVPLHTKTTIFNAVSCVFDGKEIDFLTKFKIDFITPLILKTKDYLQLRK